MGVRAFLAAVAAMCAFASSTNAHNITYIADYSLGDASGYGPENGYVDFSITTDGATGLLQQSDIIGFDVISNDFLDGSFASDNGTASLSGVYATSSRLYLKGQNSGLGFSQNNFYSELPYLTYQDTAYLGGYDSTPFEEEVLVQGFLIGHDSNYEVGTDNPRNIASITGVLASPSPEPSTWALMIVGLGLIGLALRISFEIEPRCERRA